MYVVETFKSVGSCIAVNIIIQIGQEFDRITGLNNSMQQFADDWVQVWVIAIFEVSKSEGYQINELDADGSSGI